MYDALKPNNPEGLVKDQLAAIAGGERSECSGKKYYTVRTVAAGLAGQTRHPAPRFASWR